MLRPTATQCPYCWQTIDVFIDPSVHHQDYIEDCSVCCRPISIGVSVMADGEIDIRVQTEDDP